GFVDPFEANSHRLAGVILALQTHFLHRPYSSCKAVPFIRRTNSGEHLKLTTLRALMTALVLVFGLRPIRSFLERTTKLPKDLRLTTPSKTKASSTSRNVSSINRTASFRESFGKAL